MNKHLQLAVLPVLLAAMQGSVWAESTSAWQVQQVASSSNKVAHPVGPQAVTAQHPVLPKAVLPKMAPVNPSPKTPVVHPVTSNTIKPVSQPAAQVAVKAPVKMHPGVAQGYWALVTKKYPEAAQAFQSVLNQEPNSIQAHNGLALALSNQGHYDEAMQSINKAIALDPVNSRLYFTRGQVFDAQDKAVEAIDSYLMFTSLTPDDGAALEAQRRADELQKKVGPNLSQTTNNYFQGLRLLSLRQPEQAIIVFEKVKMQEPNNHYATLMLGRAYLEAGQPEKAIPLFESTLKTQANNPMAYYQLAHSYELQGETQNARDAFRKFIQFAPQSESAARMSRMSEISIK